MDWSNLAGALANLGLTGLGTALGGPLGGTIGGAVGSAIAGALGVEPTPQAVQKAISADPDLAKAKLADLESARQAELTELQSRLADVQDARRTMVQMAQAEAPMAWGPVLISLLVVCVVAGCIAAVGAGWMQDSSLVVGAALAWMTQVITYWIGSSSGSRRNGDAVRAIAAQAPSLAEQAGAVIGRAVGKAVRR